MQIRIGKSPKKGQQDLFRPMLENFIDMNHELVLLANKIEWSYFEKELSVYYSNKGAPSVSIRMMVGCICSSICTIWEMNVCRSIGYVMFTFSISVEVYFLSISSRLIRAIWYIFRNRIGEEGMGKIFAYSVKIHGKEAEKKSKLVLSNTTVQQNNTTFPKNAKLSKKVIDKCNTIAEKEGIDRRQRYTRESKQLLSPHCRD